jgi:activating signal cointegrator 1
MKAISLWQPWASAIALGLKSVETRHWATRYTGPIAIHAAKRWTAAEREFAAVEHGLGRLPKRLPLGAIVATARLMGCRFTQDVRHQLGTIERLYGDYSDGRYAWFLTDVVALPEPVGYRGSQGLFDIPDDLLSSVSQTSGEQ